MELSAEETKRYTSIIDKILSESDLNTISEKRIRRQLGEKVDKDLTVQKKAVGALIMLRFDIINERAQALQDGTIGVKREAPNSESDVESTIPTKKQKKSSNSGISDAKLAAQLQAEENGRLRPSRGIAKKVTTTKRKKPAKKKSAAKVKGDDDSSIIGSDGEKVVKEKKGGFHKPYLLSTSMQALVHGDKMSRPQVVKKLWEHIREHNLQDPNDKRQILCDEKMQQAFRVQSLHMFTMNKLLGDHLRPCDDEPVSEGRDASTPNVKNEPQFHQSSVEGVEVAAGISDGIDAV